MRFMRFYRERATYPLRIMASLAFTLGLLLFLIHSWPSTRQKKTSLSPTLPPEVIALDLMVPTRQARSAPPPPPSPSIPIVVPDEVTLEEVDLTPELLPLEATGTGSNLGAEAVGISGLSAARADFEVGPKPVRFVEPEYTREARRARIRAEIVVEVHITASGEVRQAVVVERYLLPQRQAVDTIGYGLEAAALTAAQSWLFRPAMRNNRPISSTTRITFTFGH